jgi:signal transduction histidine kinase
VWSDSDDHNTQQHRHFAPSPFFRITIATIEMQVTDTGPVIAPAFHTHAKKLSEYREHGGTGLGLSLYVSRHVSLLAGTIHVEAAVGQGSTSPVRFPVHVVLVGGD